MAATPARSRNVQQILRLEARARRLLTRYERALGRATRAKAQAHVVLDDASSLELSLTGTELSELRRARGDVPRVQPSPHSTPPTTSAK
jgi:hypothetical protein